MDDFYIQKVLDGDTEGFRYFVKSYKDLAFTLAISVVKDEFWAEEVVQESFIKVFRNLKLFKGRSSFKTWFYRIVVNEAFQQLRQKKKHLVYKDEFTDTDLDDENMDEMATEEKRFLVEEALKLISPKESLALRLFYLEDQDSKTISEITGWSEANVRVILHRARKNMLKVVRKLMLKAPKIESNE
ncbi:MAG TPA: RNA polymerase sigma factor [Sunxiuqinia sp.]|nr:RNA polymerase sigma factor [Sunxiuqinia sp.]